MTLSDGFNQRKKIQAELDKWIGRLSQSGTNKKEYFTKAIEGDGAFEAEPGSLRESQRHYTIEECQAKIAELIEEDEQLAIRISLTNQIAKGTVTDLDGNQRELSVPELLVLRNEIIPKRLNIARAIPIQSQDVNVIEEADDHMVYRRVTRREKKKQTLTEKGHKVEETEIEGYQIMDMTDYGRNQRDVWNEIDRIQEFAESVKRAINEANKTELIEPA
jgi:hypothetical protein